MFNSFYLLARANQKSFVTQHGILWILEWSVFVPRLWESAGSCWRAWAGPGSALAPYAAPGARAWGLLISAELDRQSSANRTGPAGFAQDLSEARASSIAEVTCGESGAISGSNRVMTRPSGPMRNLVKFHLISPPDCEFEDLSVRNW